MQLSPALCNWRYNILIWEIPKTRIIHRYYCTSCVPTPYTKQSQKNKRIKYSVHYLQPRCIIQLYNYTLENWEYTVKCTLQSTRIIDRSNNLSCRIESYRIQTARRLRVNGTANCTSSQCYTITLHFIRLNLASHSEDCSNLILLSLESES